VSLCVFAFFGRKNLFFNIEALFIFNKKEGIINYITFEKAICFLNYKMDFLTVVAVVQYS
jgi:hypothetical protein